MRFITKTKSKRKAQAIVDFLSSEAPGNYVIEPTEKGWWSVYQVTKGNLIEIQPGFFVNPKQCKSEVLAQIAKESHEKGELSEQDLLKFGILK